jgi:hypothetical protein
MFNNSTDAGKNLLSKVNEQLDPRVKKDHAEQ